MNYLNPECFLSVISLEVITWLDLALYTSEVSEEGETEWLLSVFGIGYSMPL